MKVLAERGCEVFLEIGPSPTLIGMGQRVCRKDDNAWLPSLRPGRDDWQTMLESLAELYVRGAEVDWTGFDRDYSRQKIELPSYPFQRPPILGQCGRERFRAWACRLRSRTPRNLHPLLGRRLLAAVSEQIFEQQIAAASAGNAVRPQDPGSGGHGRHRLPGNGVGGFGGRAWEAVVRSRRVAAWNR